MTLTPEELEKIKSMHNDFLKAKVALGDLELTKQELLKEIMYLKADFEQNEKQLIEKYGKDAVINIKTGEITFKKQ